MAWGGEGSCFQTKTVSVYFFLTPHEARPSRVCSRYLCIISVLLVCLQCSLESACKQSHIRLSPKKVTWVSVFTKRTDPLVVTSQVGSAHCPCEGPYSRAPWQSSGSHIRQALAAAHCTPSFSCTCASEVFRQRFSPDSRAFYNSSHK